MIFSGVFAFEKAFDYGAAHHTGADYCDFVRHVKVLLFALPLWFGILNF
jgi:hypothetical protein